MLGIGRNTAGSKLELRCESEGIRLCIGSVRFGSDGNREARATGRKAARKDDDGALNAAMLVSFVSINFLCR